MGGGLGRKFEQDFISQSILIAKAVGKPVKLTWSRPQDFRNDKYRPNAFIRVRAGLDQNGALSAFIYRNVSASITVQGGGSAAKDFGAVAGATGLSYAMLNRRIEFIANNWGVPLGYWRSVGESYNTFAVECAIDELALKAGKDPVDFRRLLLANKPGLQVLNAAIAMAGKEPLPAGAARGRIGHRRGLRAFHLDPGQPDLAPVRVAREAVQVHDDRQPRVRGEGTHWPAMLRIFQGPRGRISLACATPALVPALFQGKVNAAAAPVFASTT